MAKQLSSMTVPPVYKVIADIPVVDLANPDRVSQIRAAFNSHGIFQVLNHGLPAEITLVAGSQSLEPEQDYIKKVLGELEQHMEVKCPSPGLAYGYGFPADTDPKCPSPGLAYGFPADTDPNPLTIVMMDEQVAGLQVLKECRWIAVNPRPNVFVINLGDQHAAGPQAAARGGAAGGDAAVGAEAGGAARVSAAARMMSAVANLTRAGLAVLKCASANADE